MMREKIARALGLTLEYHSDNKIDEVVDAVLDAMREPTLEMLCKGQGEIYIERNENELGPHTYASREELLDAWQAMIDDAKRGG